MWDLGRGSLEPLVNVWETEDRVIVEIDLLLVKKNGIQLRLIAGGLEVEASLTRYVRSESWETVQRGCEFRAFYKIVALLYPVVAEGASATFKRGILMVELKKRREVEYRISIQ
jgi:HSP20 family molecular chaperone IbpA